jgi:hypothetical protein
VLGQPIYHYKQMHRRGVSTPAAKPTKRRTKTPDTEGSREARNLLASGKITEDQYLILLSNDQYFHDGDAHTPHAGNAQSGRAPPRDETASEDGARTSGKALGSQWRDNEGIFLDSIQRRLDNEDAEGAEVAKWGERGPFGVGLVGGEAGSSPRSSPHLSPTSTAGSETPIASPTPQPPPRRRFRYR